jgi:hypothetical protein
MDIYKFPWVTCVHKIKKNYGKMLTCCDFHLFIHYIPCHFNILWIFSAQLDNEQTFVCSDFENLVAAIVWALLRLLLFFEAIMWTLLELYFSDCWSSDPSICCVDCYSYVAWIVEYLMRGLYENCCGDWWSIVAVVVLALLQIKLDHCRGDCWSFLAMVVRALLRRVLALCCGDCSSFVARKVGALLRGIVWVCCGVSWSFVAYGVSRNFNAIPNLIINFTKINNYTNSFVPDIS